MSVDFRTRWDGDVTPLDSIAFFDSRLPQLLEERAPLLASASHLDLRPMTVEVDGRCWVLSRDDTGRIAITGDTAGDATQAPVHLRLTTQQVSDLVNDQITPVGMMTGGALDLVRGRIGRVLDWWLVLRCALDGIAIYQAGDISLPDDLARRFTLDDDPDDMREFLESAGFLHLRGVFSEQEMGRISDEMDAAAPEYEPGDGNSWWATVAGGDQRIVRMQRFDERSTGAAELLTDPRFTALGGLLGDDHDVDWSNGNRIEALYKPIDVVEGISDVPWHKDCSLGRHSYECCMLTVGISVTGADATSGQLRVIAGSHRALVWPSLLDTAPLDLPDVPLATGTGDVTIHLSCTLHMAQPPVDRERRVLYTGFRLPPRDPAATDEAQRRLARSARETAPLNTSQSAAAAGQAASQLGRSLN